VLVGIRNARIWDGTSESYSSARAVAISGDTIQAVADDIAGGENVIDAGGLTLLPGLIDAHFHAYASDVNIPHVESLPASYLAHHAAGLLGRALDRGFTTVRDAGGADWGLWKALEDGLVRGPRLFYAGRAISQTGGHGDSRPTHLEPCGCRHVANLSEVADGVDEVRRAARETLRRGAHQIKIFVSGGVSSPSDPIWMKQFSADEIKAIVEEAERRRTYVMAHAYTADAIIHAVTNGVRSIEHGNLLDEEAAQAMAKHGAFLVPTLATYDALLERGAELGLSEVSQSKLREVAEKGAAAVAIARRAGVKIGFGTDLLGGLHDRQLHEFRLRSETDRPVDILRSATSVNAELLGRAGSLGEIRPGALADFVLVDGDPLNALAVLHEQEPVAVIKGGRIERDRPRHPR